MSAADPHKPAHASEHDLDQHQSMYDYMMRFGWRTFFPLGLAVVLFFTLLLMKAGLLTSVILSFLSWLGILAITKTFFDHPHH